MNRTEKLLDGIDKHRESGIEIGPLCRPIVKKSEARIFYVDYADAEFLRAKFRNDPGVDISQIVEIDGVWGKNTLIEATASFAPVDYVIASHVFEHVPNLISWLSEMESVLSDHGRVRLAIPDKRYTFDIFRKETGVADVLGAHLLNARIPSVVQVYDHFMNFTETRAPDVWRGKYPKEGIRSRTIADYRELLRVNMEVVKNGTYHDVHCWVFTPSSFAFLMERLSSFGLNNLKCVKFFNTERDDHEFFVHLVKTTSQDELIESWKYMCRVADTDSKLTYQSRS